MKKIFSTSALLFFLQWFATVAFSQSPQILDFGTTSALNMAHDGIIDNNGNYIILQSDSLDQFTVTSVNPYYFTANWVLDFSVPIYGNSQIEQLLDGNYLAVAGDGIVEHLVKITPSGVVLWFKNIPNMYMEKFRQDADGTIYCCGVIGGSAMMGKMDNNGNFIWVRKNTMAMNCKDFTFTADNNLLSVSASYNFVPNEKVCVTKYSKAGNEIWTKEYAAAVGMLMTSVLQSSFDNCYYMTGYTDLNQNYATSDILMAKIDTTGNPLIFKTLSYPYHDEANAIIPTSGNFCELIGISRPNATCGGANLVYVKIDSNLDTLTTRRYGELQGLNMTMYRLKKKSANEIYSFGDAYVWSHLYYQDAILVKTDTLFYLPCNLMNLPMTLASVIVSVIDTSNFVIDSVAFSTTYTSTSFSILTKDGCSGVLLTGLFSQDELDASHLFPNPASDFITLKNENETELQISIYDAQGKLIRRIIENNLMVQIEIRDLPVGFYNFVISDEKSIYSEKISIIR